MTPERLKKIREWDAATSNRDGAQEHRRELLVEVDRLTAENQQLQSKLATAVEALKIIQFSIAPSTTAHKALAAIASNAPAKTDTHEPGCPLPAELAKSPENRRYGVYCTCHGGVFNDHAMQQAAAKFAAGAAGPASKLVVGQHLKPGNKYRLGDMPLGSTYISIGDHPTRETVSEYQHKYHADAERVLVSLPSAKADEGKAQEVDAGCACHVTHDCGARPTEPEPPLTRSEVAEMIVAGLASCRLGAGFAWRGDDHIRAALAKDGE